MPLSQCRANRCPRLVHTKRSKFCLPCRSKRAAAAGRRSTGNRKRGASKITAGLRSGMKRSAKYCLVVKKTWLDLILSGTKDWEIRRRSTNRRGWIHLAESGSGGLLVGRVRLTHCHRIDQATFGRNFLRHRIPLWAQVAYKDVYTWVLEDAQAFEKPFKYRHTQGAVIWVRLS